MHVWGCPAEVRPYWPNEKKLDLKMISCYFIGFSEQSRGYKFCDLMTKSISESVNARFFEDVEFARGDMARDFVININEGFIPDFVQDTTNQDNVEEPPIQEVIPEEQTLSPQAHMPLRRSTKEMKSALLDDYIVFLQEHQVDNGIMEDDPINFHQAMESSNSQKWIDAMNEEMKSMKDNDVWDLISLSEDGKLIGCKWIFKTKRDSKGNMERYKDCKRDLRQKECINYKESFSTVSLKDSVRL